MPSLSAFITACYRGLFFSFFKFYLFSLWVCGKLHLGPLRRECEDFLGWSHGIQMKLLMVGEGVFLFLQFLTQPCLRGGPSRNNNPIRMTEGTKSTRVSLVLNTWMSCNSSGKDSNLHLEEERPGLSAIQQGCLSPGVQEYTSAELL